MKHLFVIAALFSLCFHISAQTEIKGKVIYAQNHKPVISATVTLHPVGSTSIFGYTTTANDGTFSLKRNNFPDSVMITVAAMTIEKQSKTVKSDIGFVEITVKEKTMELKEVIVNAPKIRQLGDTLNYDVSSFADETDRNIGDVLKKLPGIQVLSSGQILYQNKEINKFYIEGLDLLKGKYGLATQNVDASKVATVQILENHQPTKALKGMEIPENAAINLKLKQSAVGAFFATAQVGAGFPPVLLSNEVVGMRFTRSQQNMLVYKGDNTGRDVSRELTSYYDVFRKSSTDFLSVVTPSAPSIKEQHYLFDDAHMISLNDLRSVNKDLLLTSNLNYLYDKQKSSSFSRRDIYLDQTDTIQIQEDMEARLLKRELEGSVSLEGNTSDFFLNNTLRYKGMWNTHNSDVVSDESVSQFLKQPSFHIENNFEYLKRKDNKQRRIKAAVSYTSQRNSLDISPVMFKNLKNPDSLLRQNVSFDHFSANANLSGSKKFRRISVGYTAGSSFNHYDMESGILAEKTRIPILTDSLQNRIKRVETRILFSPSLSYNAPSGFYSHLSVPLNYLFLNRRDEIKNTKQNNGYLLFSPLLVIQYPLSARISLFSNASFSNNIGSVNEDYRGYIVTNYRNMNKSEGLLSKNRQTSAFININYKNPFTTLFTSLHLNYGNNWRNTLYDTRYNGILSSNIAILHPNSSQNWGVRYSLGKSIDAIHSEVKMSAGYNQNQGVSLNQSIISDYRSDVFSVSPSIITDIGKSMIFKYTASYSHSQTKIRNTEINPIDYFTQDISASFIPLKKLSFTTSFNHYFNNMIESSARSSWFGNLSARYKMKNVELMLDWTNIFNTKTFVTYSDSDISSYYSIYNLRPSEILLRVRFKIF